MRRTHRARRRAHSQDALHRSGVRAPRVGAHVDAGVAARRTRLRSADAGRLLHVRDRPRIDPDRAPGRRQHRRVLQRLHAPREPAARARPRPRRPLRLRLSRLAVRHRRRAAARRRPGVLSAGPAGRPPLAAAAALRHLGGLRLGEPDPQTASRCANTWASFPSSSLRTTSTSGRSPTTYGRGAVQLEDVGRRVQRGVPHRGARMPGRSSSPTTSTPSTTATSATAA